MTFTDYLTYKAPPGFKDELIHGEIRLSRSAKADRQEICKRRSACWMRSFPLGLSRSVTLGSTWRARKGDARTCL